MSSRVQGIQLQDQLPVSVGSRNVRFHLARLLVKPGSDVVLAPAGEAEVSTAVSGPSGGPQGWRAARSEALGEKGGRRCQESCAGSSREGSTRPGGKWKGGKKKIKKREQKLGDEIIPPVVVIRFFSANCIFILVNPYPGRAVKEGQRGTEC